MIVEDFKTPKEVLYFSQCPNMYKLARERLGDGCSISQIRACKTSGTGQVFALDP